MSRAATNRRARLISQIVFPSREFSSYFHSTPHRNGDVVTSHARAPPPPRRVLQTFPSMMPPPSLRWNPYVETASNVQTDEIDSSPLTYACRCSSCTGTTQKYPSMSPIPPTYIATFCNQCTMTPQVNDASCGICTGVSPPPKVKEASVSAKEPKHTNSGLDSTCEPCYPNRPRQFEELGECVARRRVKHRLEPVRDIDEESEDSESTKCFRKRANTNTNSNSYASSRRSNPQSDGEDKFDNHQVTRKILYNEGISDSVANGLSSGCSKSKASNWREEGRDRWLEPDNYIPYSHTGHSKYHHRCQEKQWSRYPPGGVEDELRMLPGCPRSVIKQARIGSGCGGRHAPPPRPYSGPPRKLLASERDVNSFGGYDRCRNGSDDRYM